MIQRFLKVKTISDLKQGKNGEYFTVTFTAKNMLPNGVAVSSALSEGTRNVFGSHSGPNGEEFKADSLFTEISEGVLKVGGLVEGEICRVQTSPYTITDKEVTTYTCVKFAHEILKDYVNRQLKSAYACMIEDGILTAPDQINRPVNASVEYFEMV